MHHGPAFSLTSPSPSRPSPRPLHPPPICLAQHNVRRHKTEKTKEEKEALRVKVEKYKLLSRALLQQRKARIYTEKALLLTERMLSRQPDFNTIWNYRREILLHLFESKCVRRRRAVCPRGALDAPSGRPTARTRH